MIATVWLSLLTVMLGVALFRLGPLADSEVWGARAFCSVLALVFGYSFVWNGVSSTWDDYWIGDAPRTTTGHYGSELWSGHDRHVYSYGVGEASYYGEGYPKCVPNPRGVCSSPQGRSMTVWYAEQRPWISRDQPPNPVSADAWPLAISIILELMVLAFVVDPQRRWATALVEGWGARPEVRVSTTPDRLRISWRGKRRRWALVVGLVCALWTGIWLNYLLGAGQLLTRGGLARIGIGTGLVALCVVLWLGGRASLQCTRAGIRLGALQLHREELRSVSGRPSRQGYELLVALGSGTEVALARFQTFAPVAVAARAVSTFLDLPLTRSGGPGGPGESPGRMESAPGQSPV